MTPDQTLAALARRLSEPGSSISMGDHAALRRMDPCAPGAAALAVYGLLSELGVPLEQSDTLRRWVILAHALALIRGGHDPSRPIGSVFVDINYGEARLAQLLSADFAILSEIVPRLARRLNALQQRMDFCPLMRLVMAADRHPEIADRARLEIARSFVQATNVDRESRKSP